jgi:hypothetical protein
MTGFGERRKLKLLRHRGDQFMPITIHPELEAKLRARADAAGISVEAYIERIARDEQAVEEEIEALAIEGLNSGEPVEIGPGYWEETHRRLDERLRRTGAW